MYDSAQPRLGLCCLLVGESKSSFKTVKLTWARNHPKKIVDHLKVVWRSNIKETCKVLDYCIKNNIWSYRLSSDMFALADLEEYKDLWVDFRANDLNWSAVRSKIRVYLELGGRLSTHPGQFCVISNDRADISARSILNLEYHAEFFDAMHIPQNYFFPINIHISNGKKEKDAARATKKNLEILTPSLRSRLVFETEDKSYWTWQKIAKHFPEIPITLDYHHRLINNQGESEQEAHDMCVKSWSKHHIKPLFHYTEGKSKLLDRSHADFIERLPAYTDMDLEIEAKQKNLAILKIQQKYS